MITIQIPVDGSSVAVADFAAAAKAALEAIPEGVSDAEKAQAKDAVAAAASLVKAGHVGSDNVFVTVGGIGQSPQLAPGIGAAILSITVSQRPAAVKPAAPPPAIAQTAPVSPYDTGPKAEEVAREAANRAALGLPGATLEAAAADLGAPVPALASAGTATPTQASGASNKPLKGQALAAATAAGKAAAKPARPLSGAAATAAAKKAAAAGAVAPAAVSPYDAGSVKASDVQSTGTPSAGSSKAAPAAAKPSAAKSGAGSPSQPALATVTSTTTKAPATAADKAPQTNPQTAKPAAGALEHQVAKDRAGK